MKLSQTQIKAVEASIRHWEKDIIANFKKGWTIAFSSWYGKDGNRIGGVSFWGEDCPLCLLYSRKDKTCSHCPYQLQYGHRCDSDDGHWSAFMAHKNLKEAINMRTSLARIIKQPEIKEGKDNA